MWRVSVIRREIFPAPSLNMVSKNLPLTAVHCTKRRGPRPTANGSSSENCNACRHGKRSEWSSDTKCQIKKGPCLRVHAKIVHILKHAESAFFLCLFAVIGMWLSSLQYNILANTLFRFIVCCYSLRFQMRLSCIYVLSSVLTIKIKDWLE